MRSMTGVRLGRSLAALTLAAALGGCALSERAETVYYHQHRAATALTETIVVAETDDPALADRLYAVESDLDDACAPLREAGYRRFSGDAVDSDLEWAVVRSLDACTAKTREVEGLLWRIDPETARYFLGSSDIASVAETN